jgi:succinate-semialdehyde dehydrogenase/glutarate-semialdehyde dehydrogenase
MQLNDPGLLCRQAFIDGEWHAAASGATYEVRNPANGRPIVAVPDMETEDARRAIHAASDAWPDWKALTAGERAAALRRWHDQILAHQEDLAQLLTAEMGKPLAEARGEIRYGASFVEWFAEEARRVYGDVIPSHAADRRIMAIKQPVGVVAAITPWNFPNAMITRKVAPALAAGCTVVIKPAEDTPLSALALAELARRAGLPAGVLNVITAKDPAPIGAELTANPLVRKLSFTGSTAVGKLLMRASADTVKKISLELGGNAPFIVFDDADLEEAVAGAVASKYRNAGQTCVCANRIYVQADVYDSFASRYAAAVEDLVVGPGDESGVAVGPLINEAALAKVERLVADAVGKGATALTGGRRHELGGTFYTPTVLTGVTSEMACAREEIFGPVAPLYRFESEEEVVRQANDTPYGLAAYFYARDVGRVWRVSEGLEYGIVGVNTGLISTAVAPFGGMKESGIGREGSRYGIDEFVEIKYICLAV